MNENKLKHLEMIQSIISRMANNSFFVKGWSITVVVAILGLANKDSNRALIVITVFPVVMFWILDTYFLTQEKRFRKLYDKVRVLKNEEIDFDMSIDKKFNLKENIFCFLSPSIFVFYSFLIVAIFIATYILHI